MSICPFAVQKILPENATQPQITPRAIILHTAVDSTLPNSSIYGYFLRADVGDESHFYVMDNGTVEQYIDTNRRADANASANGFAISIETEDDGNPHQNAWTSAQLVSIQRLVDWCCITHNIPHRQIESPTGTGIGWHSMWGINTPTSKPNPWTTANGKTCPGGPRIAQMPSIIGGLPTVALDGTEHEWLRLCMQQLTGIENWNAQDWGWPDFINGTPITPVDILRVLHRDLPLMRAEVQEVKAAVDELSTGGVDLDELADKVVDRLLERLHLVQASV